MTTEGVEQELERVRVAINQAWAVFHDRDVGYITRGAIMAADEAAALAKRGDFPGAARSLAAAQVLLEFAEKRVRKA